MTSKPNLWIVNTLFLIDFLILNACFILPFVKSYHFNEHNLAPEFIIFVFYINFCWYFITRLTGLYSQARIRFFKNVISAVFFSTIIFFFFFMIYFQILSFNYIDRDIIKRLFVLFTIILLIYKIAMKSIFPLVNRNLSKGRRVVIVGYNGTSKVLRDQLIQDPWQSNNILGFFSDQPTKNNDHLGSYQDFKTYLASNQVDDVFLVLNIIPSNIQGSLIHSATNQSVHVHIIPDVSIIKQGRFSLSTIGNISVLNLQRGPLNKTRNLVVKRIFDIVVSMSVISLMLSWLIPTLWFINRLIYKQGVFFIQKRNGLNNKTFNCVKFKTMHDNQDAHLIGAEINDMRVTRLGRFLRKSSLDEMPQFFNILLGQMSVVGPRPHMLRHTDKYRKLVKKFMIRHTVKPGLTGLAQVKGCRGSIRNFSHLRKRIQFDLIYIENWNIWLDFKIFIWTIFAIFRGGSNAF